MAALLSLGACSALKVPTEQSIQGLTPSGTVTLTEDFVTGYGGGRGTLTLDGQTYPFLLIGSVMGPGGADRITASGEVYKLAKVSDFAGRYTQGSGPAGLSRSGEGQLWLQNSAGVIMHLYRYEHGGAAVVRQGGGFRSAAGAVGECGLGGRCECTTRSPRLAARASQ